MKVNLFNSLLVMLFFALTGCNGCVDKVKIPTTPDNTPPIAKWTIHNVTHSDRSDIIVRSGEQHAPIELEKDEELLIKLEVNDPQGVRFIRIAFEASKQCMQIQGSLAQSQRETIPALVAEFPANGENLLPVNPFLLTTVRLNGIDNCDPGFKLAGQQVKLKGDGLNYFGGSVTAPELIFNLKVN